MRSRLSLKCTCSGNLTSLTTVARVRLQHGDCYRSDTHEHKYLLFSGRLSYLDRGAHATGPATWTKCHFWRHLRRYWAAGRDLGDSSSPSHGLRLGEWTLPSRTLGKRVDDLPLADRPLFVQSWDNFVLAWIENI